MECDASFPGYGGHQFSRQPAQRRSIGGLDLCKVDLETTPRCGGYRTGAAPMTRL
jgi:hypothetical protein